MSLAIEKPRLTDAELEQLNIELITSATFGTLTQERYDEIVETFIANREPPESLVMIIAQGEPEWRQKHSRRFSGNAFD